MHHKIIDQYLSEGRINKDAALRLEEFESMLKTAGAYETFKNVVGTLWGAVATNAPRAVAPVAGLVAGAGVAHMIDTSIYNTSKLQQQKEVWNSYDHMMQTTPKLMKQDPGLVLQRFKEIASISPILASNPAIASKMVTRVLKTGLDEDDMEKLYKIEVAAKQSRRLAPMGVMGRMGNTLGEMFGRGVAAVTESTMNEFITQPFSKLVAEGRQELQRRGHENNPYFRSEHELKRRLESAKADGIHIHDEVYKLDIRNPDHVKALTTTYGKDYATLFPEVMEYYAKLDNQTKQASVLADVHVLVKSAALPEGFWKGLLSATAVGLGAGVVNEVGDYLSTQRRAKAIAASWDTASKNLANLTESGHRLSQGIDYTDPTVQQKARDTFNTLVSVAPDLAINPLVAAAYVNKIMNLEEIDFGAVKTVSDIQKNMSSSGAYQSPFANVPGMRGFETGFQLAGGNEYLKALPRELSIPEDQREYEDKKRALDLKMMLTQSKKLKNDKKSEDLHAQSQEFLTQAKAVLSKARGYGKGQTLGNG